MDPILDWSSYRDAGLGDAYADIPRAGGNFARAVSVCINSRRCESFGKGVMCPSFRVSGEPALSPGGRVRQLKAALNAGQVDDELAAAGISEAMDLCVACKGCKRECENAVDMAMIKVEYLAQRHRQRRPSLRTRMLGDLSAQLHRHPLAGRLAAWRNRRPLLARLGEWALGISRTRSLPVASAETALQRQARQAPVPVEAPLDEVVLLIDTFTNNFAPENADAARRVLERAGYRIFLAQAPAGERPLCCGRTQLANGLVEQARAEARRMLEALAPHVQAGRRIVGLEPACLLAIRDDYLFLGLGDDARRAAAQALLFEEFIAREIGNRRFALELWPVDTGDQPLLVHGHCHQKAVGAMKSMRKVLKAIPELEFELIESSCCGMAGSFGIEKEHAELGMQMAELTLLPALRERPEARVLANGFSCRHQIREGSGRTSVHLARLLLEASSGHSSETPIQETTR